MQSTDISYTAQLESDGPKLDALVDMCSTQLRRNAFHPKALITRALAYSKKGMHEEALHDCTVLLSKVPEHIQGHFLRGVALDQLGRAQEALEEFSQVLTLDPSHANAALSRAACLMKLGQPVEALEDYTQGLELDSKRSLNRHRKTMSTNATRPGSESQSPDISEILRMKSFSTAVSPVPTVLSRECWSAQELYLKGYAARRNGDYYVAIQCFSAALDMQPGHFKCLFNRAYALERLEKYEEALQDYTQAIALEPRNCFALYNRGILLDRMGRTLQALPDFTAAIEMEDRAEFRNNRALMYMKVDKLEEALEDFNRSLELDRRHPRSHLHRGKCLERLGRREDAVKDFESAILLHENIEAGRLWLERQSSPDAAIQRLRSRKASEALLSYLSGLVAESLGQLDTAEQCFTNAVERKEQEGEFWLARAMSRLALDRDKEALSDCRAAESRGADVRYARALILTRMQQYESAIHDLHSLPASIAVLQALGYALAKTGKHAEAVRVYSQVLETEPNNTQALHNRGSSFQHLRKYAEVTYTQAIEDFSKELAVHGSAQAYFARGFCYELQGAADKAIADYSRALELDM